MDARDREGEVSLEAAWLGPLCVQRRIQREGIMTTLDAFAPVLAERSNLAAPAPDERIPFVYDALQHQGTPKRAAYASMPELVELDVNEDLWTLWGILGVGAARSGGLDAERSDVRARFLAALDAASHRIFERLPDAEDEREAMSLLTALSGVLRQPRIFELLESFDDRIEHVCPACGAYLSIVRRDASIEINGEQPQNVHLGGADEPLVGVGNVLLEAAALSGQANVRSALSALFGSLVCPRCSHRHRLLDETAVPSGAPVHRRVVGRSGGDTTVELLPSVRSRLVSRLVEIAGTKSKDTVRLAGVGLLGVQHYLTWPSSNPSVPPPGARVPKASPFFRRADELDGLVNGHPPSVPLPSDNPALDAFAASLFSALGAADAVDVPGLGRFEVRGKQARRGATVDGDPAIVPGLKVVAFVASLDLKRALNPHRVIVGA